MTAHAGSKGKSDTEDKDGCLVWASWSMMSLFSGVLSAILGTCG